MPSSTALNVLLTALILVILPSLARAEPAPANPVPKVLTQKLKKQEVHREILFPGRVTSQVQTEIYADGDGVVTRIGRNVGSPLKRNDVLMVIRNTDPVYRYAPLQVRTPMGGVLSSFSVTEGTQVKRGQILATVTDPRKLRVQIEVPALDLSEVRPGMKGIFESSALPRGVDAKVNGVSPAINPATGTAPAELLLLDGKAASALRPGLIGQAKLRTDSRQSILIPESALTFREGDPMVKLLEGNIAKFRKVKLGEKIRGEVELLEGVKPDDLLILRANRFVADGQKVEVEPSAPVAPSTEPAPEASTASTGK